MEHVSSIDYLKGKERILDALLEHKGYEHLLDVGSEVLHNPIVLQDISGKFIALSNSADYGKEFFDAFFAEASAKRITRETESAGIYKKVFSDDQQVFGHFSYYEHDILGRRIVVRGDVIGSVGMLLENKLRDGDRELYEDLARAIASEMVYEGSMVAHAQPAYSLIRDLIEGSVDEDELEARLDILHLVPPARMRLVVARPEGTTSGTLMNLMTSNVDQMVEAPLCLVYQSNALMIIDEAEFGKYYLDRIRSCFVGATVKIGVGDPLESLLSLSKAYEQATLAIELHERLGHTETICRYDEVRPYGLFLSAMDAGRSLSDFCDPRVKRLLDYDAENGTQLAQTLEAYLACGRNMSRCAERLFTHRNTIHYRMQKIEETIGADLEADDTCFSLEVTFKLIKLMG